MEHDFKALYQKAMQTVYQLADQVHLLQVAVEAGQKENATLKAAAAQQAVAAPAEPEQ